MKSKDENKKTTKKPEKESNPHSGNIKEIIVFLSSYLVVLSGYMFVLGYMSFRGLLNGLGIGYLYVELPFYFYLVRSIPHAILSYGNLLQIASVISIIFVLLFIIYKAITSTYKNIIENIIPIVLALDIILLTYQKVRNIMLQINLFLQLFIIIIYALLIIIICYVFFRILRKLINNIILRIVSDELSGLKKILPNIFIGLLLGLVMYGVIYFAFEQIIDSYKQGESFAEEYKQSTNMIIKEIEFRDGQKIYFTNELVILIDTPELLIIRDLQNNDIQIFYKQDIRTIKINNQ